MSVRSARGLWSGRHLTCLEMLAVFLALQHFLLDLRDRHVLVRTNNTAVVSYINHQGGLRSCPIYRLVHQILVWSQGKLLSLRAVYIPGHLNMGADILSRQVPRPGEWSRHPEVVHMREDQPCPDIRQEGGVPAWGIVLIVLLLLAVAAFVVLMLMFVRLRRENQQLRRNNESNGHELRPMNENADHDPGEEQD
ncbi:hypothetical protein PDJAM_G00143220 [Pangasius djambal]|uniref:Uncharacterized protein n=1 Tax=Pangasius djambal TaxID=1691987 RepID=A0ACC5ZEY5_9TELE|nr:hypothetical protein [Pangasius djambal]